MFEALGRFSLEAIFIGSGVCSLSLAHYYLKKFPKNRVKIIHSSGFFPAVDNQILLIVSSNGMKKGLSPLGDLLVDSFNFFKKHHSGFNGVYECDQFHLRLPEDKYRSKFDRRFGQVHRQLDLDYLSNPLDGVEARSFIVDAGTFFDTLVKEFKSNIQFIPDLVTSFSLAKEISVLTNSGQTFKTNDLFLAGGAYSKFLPSSFINSSHLQRHKTISGGVWSANCDLGEKSFILTIDMANLVYHSERKMLQIGGRSSDLAIDCDCFTGIKSNYDLFKQIVRFVPDFADGSVITSFRSKGRNRLPFYQSRRFDNNRITHLSGVYKNGYTTGPYLANMLLSEY